MRKKKQQTSFTELPSTAQSNIEELLTTTLRLNDGDDAMLTIAERIEQLSAEDRRILAHYAELRSFRQMAEVLGASATTWRREMIRIRQLITSRL